MREHLKSISVIKHNTDCSYMEYTRKKNWLIGVLVGLVFVVFFFGWLSVYQMTSVVVLQSSWLIPIICFSLGVAMLCLIAFVSQEVRIINSGAFAAFLSSIIFVQDVWFLLFAILGAEFASVGLFRMQQDTKMHIQIRIRRSIQHGAGWIVFGLALTITSFYYTQIRYADSEALLQKLSLDSASHMMLTQSLGFLNPDFKKANQENVTVDEFLRALQKNQAVEMNSTNTLSDAELLRMANIEPSDPRSAQALVQIKRSLASEAVDINTQNLVIEQGRMRLSSITGLHLTGQEPIADVLSKIIDQRIRTYLDPSMTQRSSSILPFVLSVILFVTLWSLGAVLSVVWRFATAAAFALLCRVGLVRVLTMMVEKEVID